MTLESFGWRDHFASQIAPDSDLTIGRVALASRGQFLVWTEAGDVEAAPSGRFRREATIWPTTGDWVLMREGGVIEELLKRETAIIRKAPGAGVETQVLAANIEVLFVVSGLDHDFNPRRLERYLVLAREGGVRPVIVLNKGDLAAGSDLAREAAQALDPSVHVLTLSALEGWGLDALHAEMQPGQTAALAGSSGAGKSTILNRLLQTERNKTQPVRESDSRGQHTTTSRELIAMPEGWLLMDLPGIRELQLLSDTKVVAGAFADIESIAARCRFRDCQHRGELGCAVAGEIDPARLESFHKLKKEAEHAERQVDLHAAIARKKRDKVIHRAMRDEQR